MSGLLQQLVLLRSRSRLFAAIGLVSLVLLQVSLASHQFEHVLEDSTQYCRVCVQHDRLDDGPLAADSAQLELPPTPFIAADHAIPAVPRVTSHSRARAPPTLS